MTSFIEGSNPSETDLIEYVYKPGAALVTRSPKVYSAANPYLYMELKQKAQLLRKKPTEAEKILWSAICNKQLGSKFRQQHIINRFIVDFYCIEKALALELDGQIHNTQQERDEERDSILNAHGVNILRFHNKSIYTDLNSVIKIIVEKLISLSPL